MSILLGFSELKKLILGLSFLLLCGCQALKSEDTPATLAAQNVAYGTEIAQIDANSAIERTRIQQTVAVQGTQVVILNGVNEQLLSTLSMLVTPTPLLLGESAPDDQGIVVQRSSDGTFSGSGGTIPNNPNSPYTLTGVSTQVRQDDGCIQNPQNSFTSDTSRIYGTMVANNLQAGTLIEANWYQAEQIVVNQRWTVDQNYDQLCIWFYIEPADVAFTPGSWSVQMSADGQPVSGTIGFTITGTDTTMDG